MSAYRHETAVADATSQSREPDWQSHPSVNVPDACPYCGARALHAQHCKRMCLACGWFRSCVD
jgi:hypothetical protein